MTNRVVLGNFNGGGAGIRVSKPNYDVNSNPVDNTQLIFNSDWAAMLPSWAMGQVNLNVNDSTTLYFPTIGSVPVIGLMVHDYVPGMYDTNGNIMGWYPMSSGGLPSWSYANGAYGACYCITQDGSLYFRNNMSRAVTIGYTIFMQGFS